MEAGVIQQFGQIHPLPDADVQPEKDIKYRLLFDCRKPAQDENGINPGLSHVARLINLFEAAGINSQDMDLAAVIHGPTTQIALDSQAYIRHFGRENPDFQLIETLKQNGVRIYVCGQSVIESGFDMDEINTETIIIASSALAVLANFQLRGYALMSY